MHAAIYARVSTERQERDQTINSQLAALRTWVQQQGYALLPEHLFTDAGYSGARLDRSGLDRRDAGVAAAGRQTFSVRQSSDFGRSSACMQAGPKALASSTPSHGATGRGARQRKAPTGGCAKGMPLKLTTPSAAVPRTSPLSVRTSIGSWAADGLGRVDTTSASPRTVPRIPRISPSTGREGTALYAVAPADRNI